MAEAEKARVKLAKQDQKEANELLVAVGKEDEARVRRLLGIGHDPDGSECATRLSGVQGMTDGDSALAPSLIPLTPLGRVALSDPSGSWPIPSRRRTRASSSFPTATSSSFASFRSCFASFTRAFSASAIVGNGRRGTPCRHSSLATPPKSYD